MTPVSSVANTVTAKPPPTAGSDAATGDGQAAFLDALLALIADLAGVPAATEAAPAAASETEGAPPLQEVGDTEATHEEPEVDWAELVLGPAAPAATPDSDAPAGPIVEPPPAPPAEGVSENGRSAIPPTTAAQAPAVRPASPPRTPADASDVDASTAAAHADHPASRSDPSTGTLDTDGPTTPVDADSPASRRAEGARDDLQPTAGVTTSARPGRETPPAVDAESIAAVREGLAIPSSAKRATGPPGPAIIARNHGAPTAVATPGENVVDTATAEASDVAPTGKVSPYDLAARDADTDSATPSLRDARGKSAPSQAQSRPAVPSLDATAAAAAQSGATQPVSAPTSPTPTTVVAAPVTAEQLAEVVSQEVVRATPKGEHRLEITLHPPELGRVEVNLVVGRDSVHARLVAHTEGARDLLTHHLTDLREQLVAQGFADPRLSVDLRHGSGDRGGYRADRRSDSPPREDREVAPAPGPARMAEPRDRHALHLIA